MASHRILYVGNDLALFKFLSNALSDCLIVRCPGGSFSYTFIESKIDYLLFLLDEELPDMAGVELEQFTRKLPHRKQTPIIIIKKSDDIDSLVETLKERYIMR